MNLVINATQYKQRSSGIGVLSRYLFGKFTSLHENECTVLLLKDSPQFPYADGARQIRLPFKKEQSFKRIFYQLFLMGRDYCRDSLVLTTDSKIPLVLPKTCRILPVITDLAVFKLGGTYQLSRVFLWKLQYRLLVRRAQRYIAISECTKRDLAELFRIQESKIDIVPCAAAPEMQRRLDDGVRKKYCLPERYLLFVGNFNPRKNLSRLICAFDRLKNEANLPHKLAISGEYGWKFDGKKIMSQLNNPEDVIFLGYVPDEDLPALYSMAEAFAFPSLYEGFGIPILEAQQCGTPVLTSNCSAMPEVGGQGAHYVDPYDIDDIVTGLKRLLSDHAYAELLVEKGYQNVGRFSWSESAAKLSKIVKRELNA